MKKKVNGETLRDWWLEKYFNTNSKEVAKLYPKEGKTGEWFDFYKVSQEQHDEWVAWAKEYIRKTTGYSKKLIDRGWTFIYLQYSPSIKREEENGN